MFIADTLSKSPKLSSAISKLLVRKSDPFKLLVEIKIQSTHAQVKKVIILAFITTSGCI